MSEKILAFAQEIANLQIEKRSVQGLSRVLMEMINKTVIITDGFGNIICSHGNIEEQFAVEKKLLLPSTIKDCKESSLETVIVNNGRKYECTIWPINKKVVIGYLIILARDIPDYEKQLVELVRMATGVELIHQREILANTHKFKDDFIYGILFNNYDNIDNAIQSAKTWGWDFTVPNIVASLQFKQSSSTITEIRNILEKNLKNDFSQVIIGAIGELIIILFPIYESNIDYWKQIINEFYDVINNDWGTYEPSLGVGRLYDDNSMLYRSYQESKVALELGKLTKSKRPAFFDELGAIRLFYNQSEQELEFFVSEVLQSIINYDRDKDSNLLMTLWYYFQEDANITNAAKSMFVHENTMRYRLTRIEELLGSSLENESTRFNVYGALQVATILGMIKEEK